MNSHLNSSSNSRPLDPPFLMIPPPGQLDGEGLIYCPRCGELCSHIQKVYSRRGDPSEGADPYFGTQFQGTTGMQRCALAVEFQGV